MGFDTGRKMLKCSQGVLILTLLNCEMGEEKHSCSLFGCYMSHCSRLLLVKSNSVFAGISSYVRYMYLLNQKHMLDEIITRSPASPAQSRGHC